MQNRSAPLLPELLTVRSFDYLHMCIIFPKNVRTLNAELAKLTIWLSAHRYTFKSHFMILSC